MAKHNHDHEHEHDGLPPHSHDGDHAPAHGHSHGEPTGNAIERLSFTRSQFLRMCLSGVAAAAVVRSPSAAAQAPVASKPRTDS